MNLISVPILFKIQGMDEINQCNEIKTRKLNSNDGIKIPRDVIKQGNLYLLKCYMESHPATCRQKREFNCDFRVYVEYIGEEEMEINSEIPIWQVYDHKAHGHGQAPDDEICETKPVFAAIKDGQRQLVEYIIEDLRKPRNESGRPMVNGNVPDCLGMHPIHKAVQHSKLEIVKYFMENSPFEREPKCRKCMK